VSGISISVKCFRPWRGSTKAGGREKLCVSVVGGKRKVRLVCLGVEVMSNKKVSKTTDWGESVVVSRIAEYESMSPASRRLLRAKS